MNHLWSYLADLCCGDGTNRDRHLYFTCHTMRPFTMEALHAGTRQITQLLDWEFKASWPNATRPVRDLIQCWSSPHLYLFWRQSGNLLLIQTQETGVEDSYGSYYLAVLWAHRFSTWENLSQKIVQGIWIRHVDVFHMLVSWMVAAIPSFILFHYLTWYIKYLLQYINAVCCKFSHISYNSTFPLAGCSL